MSCIGVTGELNESKLFEWKIADFFSLSTVKRAFYNSPSFLFANISLHLEIYPGGYAFNKTGFLSVFLRNESDAPLYVNNTLHIKKADGSLTEDRSEDITIEPSKLIGYEHFYDRSQLEQNKSELVPSGILTIVCILKCHQGGTRSTETADKVENLHEEQRKRTSASDHRKLIELDVLSENLKDLSVNKDSCDVVLEVDDKEFKAHKAILMARSSVFSAMFQHDTIKKQTGIIKISDCDFESFQEFLDYLYRGKLEDVSFRSAFHLYSISNKYDVQKLKEFCVEYLIQSLSPDNVCDIVQLADKYDEINLIREIQDFFNENWSKIFPTAEWENLLKNNYRLANKFLVEFSKAKGSQ